MLQRLLRENPGIVGLLNGVDGAAAAALEIEAERQRIEVESEAAAAAER